MIDKFLLKLFWRITVYVAGLAAMFFVPARTLAWPRAWVYLIGIYVVMVVTVIRLDRTNRDILVERSKPLRQKGQSISDRIILPAFLVSYYTLMILIPQDVFHMHLLPKPPWIVSSLGILIYLVGWRIAYLTIQTNPFAACVVRLQEERGHRVIDTGVYRVVRHPMYAGAILILVGLPLWLESYAAAILEIIPIGLLAVRCVLEEKFLCRNLDGYADYMQRVRFRMIPHIW
jgi:protein-S-isoprenylcysteine O-methyltransferase Ste14